MKKLSRWFKSLLAFGLSFQLASCGTILHPQREGQRGGRLDVGVVILDGVGLFFFIIPGIIAYAVDFSNGTIYLPGTGAKGADRAQPELKIVKFDARHCTPESLRGVIRANTGYDLDWRDPRLLSIKLDNPGEVRDHFAQAARTSSSESGLASR